MAGNDASFLFAGTNFNRRKYADVFDIFKKKKDLDHPGGVPNLIESENPKIEEEPVKTQKVNKKRKRKAGELGRVEGFSVFKSSKSKMIEDVPELAEDDTMQGKKEYYRQLERDAIFRKKLNIHVSGSNVPSPLQSFMELRSRYKCKPYLLRNLAELGFKEPTPIQSQAIPVLLSGRECFACAPTGSGKTFAFVCPILMRLKRASKDGVRAVILSPTKELAAQTARECRKLTKGKQFRVKLLTKQLLRRADFSKFPCDILVSTPFRMQFAIGGKKLDLSRVEFLVLDESDKLFERSDGTNKLVERNDESNKLVEPSDEFEPSDVSDKLEMLKQVDLVVKACSNPSIVRSLFSATLPDTIEEEARTIMHDAIRVIIGRKNSASETVRQKLVFVGSEEGKLLALRQAFQERLNPPALVFVQNKERAKELFNEVKYDNVRADVIHGDLSEEQRENAVDNFRAGKTWVLIATDIVARGMDFKGVNCVVNYDFPDSPAAYIHRIGRSGRAGRIGEAITLYTEADVPFLRNIANVMEASGCEVPSWIKLLRKRKWRRHRPRRESISTKPEDGE